MPLHPRHKPQHRTVSASTQHLTPHWALTLSKMNSILSCQLLLLNLLSHCDAVLERCGGCQSCSCRDQRTIRVRLRRAAAVTGLSALTLPDYAAGYVEANP